MPNKYAIRLLERALNERFTSEEHWCKHAYAAKSANPKTHTAGPIVPETSKFANCWCSIGVIHSFKAQPNVVNTAWHYLDIAARRLTNNSQEFVLAYNDYPTTTFDKIQTLFRLAIKLAKAD